MSRKRGWIRVSIVSLLAWWAGLLVTPGCSAPTCERPTLELAGDPNEPSRKSSNVEVRPYIRDFASHIRVGCKADWSGEGGIRVSICALDRCEHADGRQAHLDLWPRDWDRLPELEHVYCFVIQKEQQIFEGPWFNPQLVKTLPERTLLAARIPVVAGCRAAPEGPRYCADGHWQDDRWICTHWTR